jgi:hypothetical protein
MRTIHAQGHRFVNVGVDLVYVTTDVEIIIAYVERHGKQLDRRRLSQEQRDRLRGAGFRWCDKNKHWRKESNERSSTCEVRRLFDDENPQNST